ncbi:hypothetical protein MMC30_008962 [Trapelia coarctata]|nr:hypothetical protein [Trapelia coarctata]
MASLILGLGALTYDKVKTSREKRRARKESNAARFAELEKENAERMARLHPKRTEEERVRASEEGKRGRESKEGERERSSGEGREGSEGGDGRGRDTGGGEGGRPPAYESLVMEGKGGSRGFWKKGDKGEGVVR